MHPLVTLLGLHRTSPEVNACIDQYGLVEDANTGLDHLVYLESPRHGLALSIDHDVVDAVFLHGNGKDDFSTFRGPLPGGLTFDCDREAVRRLLGSPAQSCGRELRPETTFEHGGFDRFNVGPFHLHLSYAISSGLLELVTLMRRPHGG